MLRSLRRVLTGAYGTGMPVSYELPGLVVGAICDRPVAAGCVPRVRATNGRPYRVVQCLTRHACPPYRSNGWLIPYGGILLYWSDYTTVTTGAD